MEASTNIIIVVSYHHDLECHAMPWNDRIKRNLKLSDLDTLMTVVQTGAMGRAFGSIAYVTTRRVEGDCGP
jgi:hypothetical protein